MKTICFVLPEVSNHPIGGYKIAFEYANRLANDNFNVKILFLNDNALKKYHVPKLVKHTFENIRTKREPRWFNLNPRIEKISSTQNNFLNKLKNVDVAIATAVDTAYPVKKMFSNCKKAYLIQDFEDWNVSRDFVFDTYKLGFKNIVVSKWLKNLVDKYSIIPSTYVQNPLDTESYKVINPISSRELGTIGMLYHESPIKGCKYTIAAIKEVKKLFPELQLIMFGAYDPPTNLPNWVNYYKNASKSQTIEIYNNISIFVSGSIKEGFGLTGLEAMACGAALVSTDYLGVKEYAINNENCLLSPIKSVTGLKDNIFTLIKDDKLREKLATSGMKTAQNFAWSVAYTKFKEAILD